VAINKTRGDRGMYWITGSRKHITKWDEHYWQKP